MLRLEKISEALLATPPTIRGVLHEHRIRRMSGYEGEGPNRVFEFDVVGKRTYRELLREPEYVALDGNVSYVRLKIVFQHEWVNCPACLRRVKAGAHFWSHYDAAHAKRPKWLNEADWIKMIGAPYVPPPEQQ